MSLKCFMGCEPPVGGGQEAFYVAVLPELTIYGHTINKWVREKYPEDWEHVRDTQSQGILWGCWHSVACHDGEMGSQDPAICWPMEKVVMMLGRTDSEYDFLNAMADEGWPDLISSVGVTANRPAARIFVPEGDTIEAFFEGPLREVWNSLEGDKE